MVTKMYKVYGHDGHRQKVSFSKSQNLDFSTSEKMRLIKVLNSDITGTNDYSVVIITMNTSEECDSEMRRQSTDGIFENANSGRIEDFYDEKLAAIDVPKDRTFKNFPEEAHKVLDNLFTCSDNKYNTTWKKITGVKRIDCVAYSQLLVIINELHRLQFEKQDIYQLTYVLRRILSEKTQKNKISYIKRACDTEFSLDRIACNFARKVIATIYKNLLTVEGE